MKRIGTVLVVLLCLGSLSACDILRQLFESSYVVAYNDNGATGGSVPTDSNRYLLGDTVIVLGNNGDLAKAGYTFAGWNMKADGTGTTYAAGGTFTMDSASLTLYAVFTQEQTYAVTYNSNGATSGSAPADSNSYMPGTTATVLGNAGSLANPGYAFAGWNTKADGSGTIYSAGSTFAVGSANVTLFAMWNSQSASLVDAVITDSVGTPYSLSFDPGIYDYTGSTVYLPTNDTYIVTFTASDPNAKVISVTEYGLSGVVADSSTGSNYTLTLANYNDIITIVVRAQDGTIAHYWVSVQAQWFG